MRRQCGVSAIPEAPKVFKGGGRERGRYPCVALESPLVTCEMNSSTAERSPGHHASTN